MLPRAAHDAADPSQSLASLLGRHGFDRVQHEQIQADLRSGRIGLAQNRLPASSRIEDVAPDDIVDATAGLASALSRIRHAGDGRRHGRGGHAGGRRRQPLDQRRRRGQSAASVLEAGRPPPQLHRSAPGEKPPHQPPAGVPLPHVITTSYLTHDAVADWLAAAANYGYPGPFCSRRDATSACAWSPWCATCASPGRKCRSSFSTSRPRKCARACTPASSRGRTRPERPAIIPTTCPMQCLHPVGHWYELPNLFCNGVLARLLEERPRLRYLMLHNIDTLGADLAPDLLGLHIESGAALTTEVIARQIDDRGGGLARIDGRVRLVEGLALPDERIEFQLSYYNSATYWIDLDRLLPAFSLTRADLARSHSKDKVAAAVRALAARMPTYITLKDVKKRWGKGQEDIFPVAQFEKLWGDMTALPELDCRFVAVPRNARPAA
jgi:hypothetical protein